MKDVFSYKSYPQYLEHLCQSERGTLSRLSEAAGCQKSYLSTCLKGKTLLTMDHAFGIADYLKMSEQEKDYFFLLVEKERASTPGFRKYCEKKLIDFSREAYRLKNQTRDTVILSTNESAQIAFFYQTWLPAAAHMLSSVPRYQNIKKMAARLQTSEELVLAVLEELKKHTLVEQKDQNFLWSSSNVHLPDDNPLIINHHQNWRLRAINDIQKSSKDSLHYSVVQSMSEEDFEVVKKRVSSYIKNFHSIADPSVPEEAYCFNIDLFKV